MYRRGEGNASQLLWRHSAFFFPAETTMHMLFFECRHHRAGKRQPRRRRRSPSTRSSSRHRRPRQDQAGLLPLAVAPRTRGGNHPGGTSARNRLTCHDQTLRPLSQTAPTQIIRPRRQSTAHSATSDIRRPDPLRVGSSQSDLSADGIQRPRLRLDGDQQILARAQANPDAHQRAGADPPQEDPEPTSVGAIPL